MSFKIVKVAFLAFAIAACHSSGHESENHDENEEVKFQYTSYSKEYELFAEADAFIIGESANVLSHFSRLPDFKPFEAGKITIVLTVNGNETRQEPDNPIHKGIYSFNITPETQGKGSLKFEITGDNGIIEVVVPEITVFESEDEAHEASKKAFVSTTNTTVFTKEQSWKIDFSTAHPKSGPFGQVIKTTALVQPSQGSEMVVAAKTNGIVVLSANNLTEGMDITSGQSLFSISGGDFTDDNISVKYAEAKSNFEKAKMDYERARELANDRIVSEKDLMTYRNQFENSQVIFDNLNKNFNASGQNVKSPISGFLKQVFVKNGTYVEAGRPILTVSQNKTLILNADVPQKYTSVLGTIETANIRTLHDNHAYTFDELNGKVLSFGKAANSDNYLIPVSLQIDNKGNFTAGSFVEVYLKTISNVHALIVPNSSLMEEQGIFFVWVQVTPELFEKREVVIGETDGIHTEVLQGITINERIVTLGTMLIKLAQTTGTLDAHSGHVH